MTNILFILDNTTWEDRGSCSGSLPSVPQETCFNDYPLSFAFSIYLLWHHPLSLEYSQDFPILTRKHSLNFCTLYFSWNRQGALLNNSKISVVLYNNNLLLA